MYREEFYLKNEIHTKIKFDKDMETVYQLSYFLVDFQAIINNFTEMVINSEHRGDIKDRQSTEERALEIIEEWKGGIPESYQKYEKELPEGIRFLDEALVAAPYPKEKKERLKQTTNRRFNKKYQQNLCLRGFAKGSLVIDVANSLLVSIFTEFLKELVFQKTGNETAINITITNSLIYIDDSVVKMISPQSCVDNAIRIDANSNTKLLDVQKCAQDIVKSAKPSEDIEQSVERLLSELRNNNLINESVIYDSRGKKTAVRDIERFVGHFVDVSI